MQSIEWSPHSRVQARYKSTSILIYFLQKGKQFRSFVRIVRKLFCVRRHLSLSLQSKFTISNLLYFVAVRATHTHTGIKFFSELLILIIELLGDKKDAARGVWRVPTEEIEETIPMDSLAIGESAGTLSRRLV